MTAPAIKHGTIHAYRNRKCRCTECRGANAAYGADLRARKAAGKPIRVLNRHAEHGTVLRYHRGCRCEPCRGARHIYVAEWKLRTGRSATSALLAPPAPEPAPSTEIIDLLEARERALSVTVATAPRSVAGVEARHRRAEVRDLLAHLRAEVTS